METDLTWREKRAERDIRQEVDSTDRFVNLGVSLYVVTTDPSRGQRLIDGCPPMRIVDRLRFPGVVDTAADPACIDHVLDESEDRIWHCSVEQAPIILHADSDALGKFVHGSEGAGKTSALAMWHYFRWREHLGERRMGGQFAPTLKRLGLVQKEIEKLWRPTWGRYVIRRNFEGFELCEGSTIFFQSTHKGSAAGGSQIQGSNLSWTGEDEKQDMVAKHADIMSRGRSARNGRCKRLGTTTNKDDSAFRDLRDALISSGQWKRHTLSIFRSPFVDPSFLDTVKPTISPREFLRRYGDPVTHELPDMGPELAVYYGWLRSRNLVALPQIAKDVTASVLSGFQSYLYPGRQFGLVCSHDPGVIFNTTEVLRLVMFRDLPTWIVVGELQTKQTTARQHAVALRAYLRDEFFVHHPTSDGPLPILFCDPHGKGEGQTDYQSVYMAFQKEGIDVFNPAGIVARISRKARVEMMNRLLGGSSDRPGVPRLVIATDLRGAPVAPKLVEAFETLQKKAGDENPEGSRSKDVDDKTHAPAAAAYGLWMFEQESVTEATVKTARRAAGMR